MYALSPRLLEPPLNRWDPAQAPTVAPTGSGRDEVLYRSHLIGADAALTKEGGGNFSAKGVVPDHRGIPTRVLWMSSWGCDGASTTAEDFPAVRLDDLSFLLDSGAMTDRQMVDYILASALTADQRQPGIETLTHAFIPAAHVDHCHPDAVIALTAIPNGRELAAAEFGDEAIWFDYRQYDIGVAKELAHRIAAQPGCRFVLLANHGLFTWADTSEQCYRNSLEAVARATRALEQAVARPPDLGGTVAEPQPDENARELFIEILPVIRGALSAGTSSVVMHVERDDDAVQFASSARGPWLSMRGPGCPDSLVTAGYRPLALEPVVVGDPDTTDKILHGIDRHRRWYRECYGRHITPEGRKLGMGTDAPRVALLPGLGVVSCGIDAGKARLCADHFRQTMNVIRAADAAGGYSSLTEAQGVADEYWPLMRLKPLLTPPQGRMAGRIALVCGPDDQRVIEVAERLAAEDAHVSMCGSDHAACAEAAKEIIDRHGERRATALRADVRDERAVVRDAALAYGGFDVVVDMKPTGGLAHAALPVFVRQGLGGSVVLAGIDRTVLDLRAEVDELRDSHGPYGLTVNAVATPRPDAVAEAAMFFGGRLRELWNDTVLRTHRSEDEEVEINE